MIAVPTRELSGQAPAFACGRRQERDSAAWPGAIAFGSTTSARLSAACSGSKRRVVDTGGWSPRSVSPGAPTEPSADASKGSLAQFVGLKAKLFCETAAGA